MPNFRNRQGPYKPPAICRKGPADPQPGPGTLPLRLYAYASWKGYIYGPIPFDLSASFQLTYDPIRTVYNGATNYTDQNLSIELLIDPANWDTHIVLTASKALPPIYSSFHNVYNLPMDKAYNTQLQTMPPASPPTIILAQIVS